jgi:hypothetical protein
MNHDMSILTDRLLLLEGQAHCRSWGFDGDDDEYTELTRRVLKAVILSLTWRYFSYNSYGLLHLRPPHPYQVFLSDFLSLSSFVASTACLS